MDDLELNFVTDKRAYRVGEPIQFTYTIKNVGTSIQTVLFPQARLILHPSTNGTPIAVSPQGGGGIQIPALLPPGQVITEYYQWTTLYASQTPIPAGEYRAFASPGPVVLNQKVFTAEEAKAHFYANAIQFSVK